MRGEGWSRSNSSEWVFLAGEFVGVVGPEFFGVAMGEARARSGHLGGLDAFSLTSMPKKFLARCRSEADFGELAFVLGEEAEQEALFRFSRRAG